MSEENVGAGYRNPKGVGGWLAFYVWSNLVTLPFFIVAMLSYPEYLKNVPPQFLEYLPKDIPLYERVSLALVAAFQDFACLLLLTRRPGAVELTKQSLQAQMGFIIAKTIILVMAPSQNAGAVAAALEACLNAILFPVIWYLYFQRSRRVRNTYSAGSLFSN